MGRTLDELTVRDFYSVFLSRLSRAPNCLAAWEKALGTRVHWEALGQLFQGGLLTPKDYSSYFKNILHRALLIRSKKPAEDGSTKCRLCGGAEEHFPHFAVCPVLRPLWHKLAALAGVAPCPALALVGTLASGGIAPLGALTLWVLVWKFAIIQITQVSTEGRRFDADAVWKQALRRWLIENLQAQFIA